MYKRSEEFFFQKEITANCLDGRYYSAGEEKTHGEEWGKKISEAMLLSKLEKIGFISGGPTSDGRPLLGTTARQNIVRSGMPVYIYTTA